MYSKTIDLLKRVLNLLSSKRKKSLYKIIPLAIITGLSDVLVVAMVSRLFVIVIQKENRPSIPFTTLITDDPFTKLILLISVYIAFNWLASFLRLSLRAFQEKLRASVFIDLSEIAQRNIFNQKYDFFLSEKSENISSKIVINISKVAEKFVRPILQIVSGFFIVSFIFIAILSFAKITAFYLIICLVIGYTLISFCVSPLIRDSVKQRIILEKEINKVLTESVRTIIDVHLTGSEKFFQERYLQAGKQAFPYLWKAETLPEFPRSLVEPFGITLIFSIGLFPFVSDQNINDLIDIVPFLATIASVSPYIGLFGTVWGIMNSFRGLAGSSQATLSAVAPGISEALIATAIGLFAAIPALIAYNKYISDSDRLISSFEGFKEEFSSVLHRDMQSDKK